MNIQQFETMLAQGRDSSLLRFGLGKAYLDAGDAKQAVVHLSKCLEHDPTYSAAWSLLGQAQLEVGDRDAARQTWENGITAAQKKGDIQASKMMTVFLKRLDKDAGA